MFLLKWCKENFDTGLKGTLYFFNVHLKNLEVQIKEIAGLFWPISSMSIEEQNMIEDASSKKQHIVEGVYRGTQYDRRCIIKRTTDCRGKSDVLRKQRWIFNPETNYSYPITLKVISAYLWSQKPDESCSLNLKLTQ